MPGIVEKLVGLRAWSPKFIRPTATEWFGDAPDRERLSYLTPTIREVAELCVSGKWDVPKFQRGFVWSVEMVRDLAESLWQYYPLGLVLLWKPDGAGSQTEKCWIVDGQQRLTAICKLFGELPHWYNAQGSRRLSDADIVLDLSRTTGPIFHVRSSSEPGLPHLIPLSRILKSDTPPEPEQFLSPDLLGSVERIRLPSRAELSTILNRVWQIRTCRVPVAVVSHSLEDVLEMYERLSGGGLRFRRLILRILNQAIRARWTYHVALLR